MRSTVPDGVKAFQQQEVGLRASTARPVVPGGGPRRDLQSTQLGAGLLLNSTQQSVLGDGRRSFSQLLQHPFELQPQQRQLAVPDSSSHEFQQQSQHFARHTSYPTQPVVFSNGGSQLLVNPLSDPIRPVIPRGSRREYQAGQHPTNLQAESVRPVVPGSSRRGDQ